MSTKVSSIRTDVIDFILRSSQVYQAIAYMYRDRIKGFGQVRLILFLLMLTTSAWACLQHSRNLAEAFSRPLHTHLILGDLAQA